MNSNQLDGVSKQLKATASKGQLASQKNGHEIWSNFTSKAMLAGKTGDKTSIAFPELQI